MREITTHQVNAAPSALRILVLDEPGPGGANHLYEITGFHNDPLTIGFQNGPILIAGTNGITQEVLLAIVRDRLESFQAGECACTENRLALNLTGCALDALKLRTERRVRQKTEGQNAETARADDDNGEGVLALVGERFRQITEEGYDSRHDDIHDLAELATAGLCYASLAQVQALALAADEEFTMSPEPPPSWPWDKEHWKPSLNPQRNLEKAGALFAAEWDRLERRAQRKVADGRAWMAGLPGASEDGETGGNTPAKAPDVEVCEGCAAPATTYDSENVPLCAGCAALAEEGPLPEEAPEEKPADAGEAGAAESQPEQPPIDNDHMAEGCEQFPEAANETEATGESAGKPEGAA